MEAGEENRDSLPSPHDLVLPVPDTDESEAEKPSQPPLTPGKLPRAFEFDVPVVRNVAVDRWIEYFTGPGRRNFSLWLQRSGRYVPHFKQVFRENNLPEDLAYISLIESGFSLKARSRAGAVGPWQFMSGTARFLGLKVNRYLDERRSPLKSTRAAAAFLKSLYEEFGDWHMALAAYNAGERRIQRAIRATGRKNYWAIVRSQRLPQETRNYVAKFLAGLIIAKNPEVFGFVGIDYQEPLRFDAVKLPRGISLRVASRLAGVPIGELAELNAELRWRITPPGGGYTLLLPRGRGEIFRKRLADRPKEILLVGNSYRIRRGDTFGQIANRLEVPLRKILELNAHLDPRRLRIGTTILLPGSPSPRQRASIPRKKSEPSHHVVGPGDNVWGIARRYGVSPESILRLNDLSASATIFPGDRLRIRR